MRTMPKERNKIGADDRAFVSSLSRGLAVMRAFTNQNEKLRLTEIAEIVGLPRATVRRCLLTLESLGYVASDGISFCLAPQVLTLAHAFLTSNRLPQVAQTTLERISQTLGESCSASVLDGDEVIYVARSTKRRLRSLHRDVGSRLPVWCTSMGRVLLAFQPREEIEACLARVTLSAYTAKTMTDKDALRDELERVRRQEYSLIDEELELGLLSIAVPVRNAPGQVVAALHASFQAGRHTPAQLVEHALPVLREAAAEMRPLLIG